MDRIEKAWWIIKLKRKDGLEFFTWLERLDALGEKNSLNEYFETGFCLDGISAKGIEFQEREIFGSQVVGWKFWKWLHFGWLLYPSLIFYVRNP